MRMILLLWRELEVIISGKEPDVWRLSGDHWVIGGVSTVVAVPVGFLSDDQVRAYTAFEELPSLSDLEKFFFLDAFDRDVIAKSRQDSHRFG